MQSDEIQNGQPTTDDDSLLAQKLQESLSLEQGEKTFNESLQDFSNDEPIFITVSNPSEVKSSQLNKHLVYLVKGRDALGQFEVQRRFNEFYTLRECLLLIWPGLYIPPIPEKQINPTGEQLLERIRLLNIFVMKMAQIKYLYYSEEFANVFLRSTQTDVCKQMQNLPKPNVKSQIDKYKHLFEINEIQEPDVNALNKINLMQKFCKTHQSGLAKYLDQAKNLSASKRILKDLFHSIFGSSLFEYEQLILKPCIESENQLLFCNPTAQELKSTLDYLKDQQNFSVDRLQDLITTEQRDLEGFLEAFQTREQLLHTKTKVEGKLRELQEQLTKVMSGKTTVKNQEESRLKLEMQIIEFQNEVDQYKYYYQIVTHVLITKAIDKFKKDKHEAYKRIIRDLAAKEVESNQVMQEVWARIMSLAESLKLDNHSQ